MTDQEIKEKPVKKLEIYLDDIIFEDVIYGCPLCNTQVNYSAKFCPECGVEFKEE